MILGDDTPTVPVMQGKSLLESFLGVAPGYLKEKLDGIELLLWLSVAGGLSGALVSAINLYRRRA